MFVLGLLLFLVSGAVALGVILSNTDKINTASAFGVSITNVTIGGLFLAGVVAGLVLMLGLALMVAGAARKRQRRVETKRTVKGVRSEREQLAAENEQLRSELQNTRNTSSYPPDTGTQTVHSESRTSGRSDGGLDGDTSRTNGANDSSRTEVVQEKRGLFRR